MGDLLHSVSEFTGWMRDCLTHKTQAVSGISGTSLLFLTFLVMLLQAGNDTHVTSLTKDFRSLSMGQQPPPNFLRSNASVHPALLPSRGLAKAPAHFLGLKDKRGLRGLNRRKLQRPGRVSAPSPPFPDDTNCFWISIISIPTRASPDPSVPLHASIFAQNYAEAPALSIPIWALTSHLCASLYRC